MTQIRNAIPDFSWEELAIDEKYVWNKLYPVSYSFIKFMFNVRNIDFVIIRPSLSFILFRLIKNNADFNFMTYIL